MSSNPGESSSVEASDASDEDGAAGASESPSAVSVEAVNVEAASVSAVSDGAVNYDEAAVVELELDGTDYRLDSGRAGTALCISTRATGTWGWEFRGEARWQNNVLRCKAFDRSVLTELSKALVEASADAG